MGKNSLFNEAAKDILSTPEMRQSKKYIQHGKVTVYSHSIAVAKYSQAFARKIRLRVDERSLIRGALLHDFFLYDWHDDWDKLHGFKHPRIALENAGKQFSLNRRERDIIRKHMWPMTFANMPRCREAWVVCAVDKYVSLLETFKILRYNYD
ncbi:MAG: HD domain-containing protein [Oscillospiraceae bacterium]|nr:HD domain-containing protein [Oscillospiraceae bacterium]